MDGFLSDDNYDKICRTSSIYKCFDNFSDAIAYAHEETSKEYYEYGIQLLSDPPK